MIALKSYTFNFLELSSHRFYVFMEAKYNYFQLLEV